MSRPRKPEPTAGAGDARLRTLSSVRSIVLWHTDADGSVRRDNPSWQAYTGQSRAEYQDHGWLDAIHPDDRAAVHATWQRAVATGQAMETTYRLRRHDGEYRTVSAQGAAVLEGGRVREWVGLCVDITATMQVEAALRANEERLALLDRVGEATRVLPDATDIMATTARLLGEHLKATRCAYADVEPDGDRFTIRSDWSLPGVPSSAGVYSLALFGPQATHDLRRGEHLVVNDVDAELGDAGGARMFNAIGIKAIICAGLVKDGRLVAMMAVHQATPRRWTAQDVAIVAEVVDRCWAHIERVRDAAALREQDRRKDEFLATLAHELRNPLAPMTYALALLDHAADEAARRRAREVLARQTGHMARLVDDLLDISRINRGLIRLQRRRVALRELVQQAVETARPLVDAPRHHLTVQLPDPGLEVDADPTRLVQVVSNLLANACKYTPDGGAIRVAAYADGAQAVVEVADNGIGIPPADQARIFQMFTQLPHSAGKAKGGLGIGLSLVKALVDLHGGRVAVHSDGLDQGTRFSVTLPALTAGAAAGDPAAPGDTAPAASLAVLVVEDNDDGRETLVTLLRHMGHAAEGAPDGESALQRVQQRRPQVVLLDIGLPGMDGVEVARRLRAQGHDGLRLVAVTGWGGAADRARTAAAGFDAHLTKPVEPGALLALLAQLVARAPAKG